MRLASPRPWLVAALSLLLVACSPKPDPVQIVQCVAKLDEGCKRGPEAGAWCRRVAARTAPDRGRGCNALRWSIPRAHRPGLVSVSDRGDTLRFATGFPGIERGGTGHLVLTPLPNRDHREAIKLFRAISGAEPAQAGPAGYTAYAGASAESWSVLLVPDSAPEYYVECSSKPEAPTVPHGACEVWTGYLDVLHFRYSILARDVASVPALNRRIGAKLDGFRAK